jgi:hypothetical protein
LKLSLLSALMNARMWTGGHSVPPLKMKQRDSRSGGQRAETLQQRDSVSLKCGYFNAYWWLKSIKARWDNAIVLKKKPF